MTTVMKVLKNLLALVPQDTLLAIGESSMIKLVGGMVKTERLDILQKEAIGWCQRAEFSSFSSLEKRLKMSNEEFKVFLAYAIVSCAKLICFIINICISKPLLSIILIDQYDFTIRLMSLQLLIFNTTVGPEIVNNIVIVDSIFKLFSMEKLRDFSGKIRSLFIFHIQILFLI